MRKAGWSSEDCPCWAVSGTAQDPYAALVLMYEFLAPELFPPAWVARLWLHHLVRCKPRVGSREAESCHTARTIAWETSLSSTARAVKPPRVVDLGSFYWCVSRLGCVRGKLPISRDCASRKGSYWNLKPLPPLQICSFVLSLAGQGRVTSWLSDSFCYSMFRSASSFP